MPMCTWLCAHACHQGVSWLPGGSPADTQLTGMIDKTVWQDGKVVLQKVGTVPAALLHVDSPLACVWDA